GSSLVLQNLVLSANTTLVADNSTASASNTSDGSAVSRLLALPGLVQLSTATAQLVLTNVSVQCSCSWLAQLQSVVCSQLQVQQLSALQPNEECEAHLAVSRLPQVLPGLLFIPAWQGTQLQLNGVEFSCSSEAAVDSSDTSSQGTGLAQCAVQHVSQWAQLAAATVSLQAVAVRVIIVLDASLAIPSSAADTVLQIYRWAHMPSQHAGQARANLTSHAGACSTLTGLLSVRPTPAASCLLWPGSCRDVRLMAQLSPVSPDGPIQLSMDCLHGKVVWRVDPLRGTLTFQGLVLQHLPMGRASNMPWGSIGWGIWAVSAESRLYPRPGYSFPLAGSFPCSGQKHSSSGRHLLSPIRCMFSAELQSLSTHLPGCGAGLALAALPLPFVGSAASGSALVRLLRLAGRGVLGPGSEAAACEAAWLLRGACGGLRGATTGHHIMPRTGWSRCWLQAGRTRRCSTCPAGGFQPAGLVALRLFSCLSQGCWPFTAELTRVVRCSSTSTTLPRRWSVPLGLHTTLQQARSTASAPQPPPNVSFDFGAWEQGGFIHQARAFGVLFKRTQMTSSETQPGMPPSQCPPLDYGKLFSNPVPPFPSIMWIISPAQLIQALVGSSTAQYLVLLNNMSVSAADWAVALPAASTAPGSSSNNSSSNMSGTSGADPPPGLASVSLSRSITLSGWPGVMTVLDWQGMADQLLLTSAASLTLRNLVIMNGAPQSAPALAQTLVKPELAPYTGPFILHRDQLSLTLQQAVQVVLWPAAFNAVKQVSGFHSMPQVPGNALPPELMVYSSALGEASFLGVDVTLLSLAAGDAALGLPYPSLPPPIAASLPKALPTGIDTQTSAADKAIVAKLGLLVGLLPAFILTGVGCWAWWAQRKEQLATTAPVTDAEASLEADTRAGVQAELPRAPHDPDPFLLQPAGRQNRGRAMRGPAASQDKELASPARGGVASRDANNFLPSSQTFLQVFKKDFQPSSTAASTASSVTQSTLPWTSHNIPHTSSAMSRAFNPEEQLARVETPNSSLSSASVAQPAAGPSSGRAGGIGMLPTEGGQESGQGRGDAAKHSRSGDVEQGQEAVTCSVLTVRDSNDSSSSDSFDKPAAGLANLLINQVHLSESMQESMQEPGVAQQLHAMINNMQQELQQQEVEILCVIGQGAFGVVYKGTWKGLTVAVKTLVFTALPSMPVSKRQQRAMTEAAICRTMQHPNIVATYAYDLQVLHAASGGSGTLGSSQCSPAHSGGPGPSLSPLEPLKHPTEFKVYIIQEFCDGGTLTAAVDGGMLEDMTADQPQPIMAHVLQLATDIAAGMAHVHSRNVVHGDLTPSNILLRAARSTLSGYVAKVAGEGGQALRQSGRLSPLPRCPDDCQQSGLPALPCPGPGQPAVAVLHAGFGLSWKLTGGQEHVSNARQGTACYIAPEVMHTGIMSKPADVFSFGMLLHEMYHGTPPWRLVKQRDVGSSRTRHADAAKAARLYPGVQSMHWAPTCPPEFRLLTEACLASNPQERPTFFVIVEKLLALQQALRQAASQAMGLPTPVLNTRRHSGIFLLLPGSTCPTPSPTPTAAGPGSRLSPAPARTSASLSFMTAGSLSQASQVSQADTVPPAPEHDDPHHDPTAAADFGMLPSPLSFLSLASTPDALTNFQSSHDLLHTPAPHDSAIPAHPPPARLPPGQPHNQTQSGATAQYLLPPQQHNSDTRAIQQRWLHQLALPASPPAQSSSHAAAERGSGSAAGQLPSGSSTGLLAGGAQAKWRFKSDVFPAMSTAGRRVLTSRVPLTQAATSGVMQLHSADHRGVAPLRHIVPSLAPTLALGV
ncbi:hypothetical protein QJQ45_028913, partial [Haematococcus lacustris]